MNGPGICPPAGADTTADEPIPSQVLAGAAVAAGMTIVSPRD